MALVPEESGEENRVERLAFALTPVAREEIQKASEFLTQSVSLETATRFYQRFNEEVSALRIDLAEQIARSGRPEALPHEEASLYFSRPTFRHAFYTGQGRRPRRSSSGLWHLFYEIADKDGDGKPDTLIVHRVRHSAARPLSVEAEEE